MDVEYTARGVGVGPGRKPKECPEELLDMLRHTYEHRVQANIDISRASTAEIAEVCTLIVNGAKQLGLVGRVFGARSGRRLKFYAEDRE